MPKESSKETWLRRPARPLLGDVGETNMRHHVRRRWPQPSHDRTERRMIRCLGAATLFASIMPRQRRINRSGMRIIDRVIH